MIAAPTGIAMPTPIMTRHPPPVTILPIFRCRPLLVNGIPIEREILDLAAEIPTNLFHEKPPRCRTHFAHHLLLLLERRKSRAAVSRTVDLPCWGLLYQNQLPCHRVTHPTRSRHQMHLKQFLRFDLMQSTSIGATGMENALRRNVAKCHAKFDQTFPVTV